MNKSVEVLYDYRNFVQEFEITQSRERRNIIYKYAYINALKPFLGCSDAGHVIGCNHATILHAWRAHETNMRYSRDRLEYADIYEMCVNRISNSIGDDCDPLFFYTKGEVIRMYRSLEKKYEGYAKEPYIEFEEISGV